MDRLRITIISYSVFHFLSILLMQNDQKLLALLDVVIDNYISKWEPVGSKFLHSLGDSEYAPSTLRKYLHVLEQQGMVYQPYNSSWRIPTVQWLVAYIENYLSQQDEEVITEVINARKWLKYLVETLWALADWVVVWFLRNDEYYYLWINNLLKDEFVDEYQATRNIISFIEEKKLVKFIDGKMLKRNHIYYTFIDNWDTTISCLYAKVHIDNYDAVISIIWSTRVDYKKNVSILRKLVWGLES
jgi:transcriptional regulator of heat shock response